MSDYIHGYSKQERTRLWQQGSILSKYIYKEYDFTSVKKLLEIGSGVGAQLAYCLSTYPHLHMTGIELSPIQIQSAKQNLHLSGIPVDRYQFIEADAKNTGLSPNSSFDAALFVWVLEHIPNPEKVLEEIKRILRPGTPVYITEVFDNSLQFFPHCPNIHDFWHTAIRYQYAIQGDPNIGPRLGNLLEDAGYQNIQITPHCFNLDKRTPNHRLEMLQYWEGLTYSKLENVAKAGLYNEQNWNKIRQEFITLREDPNAVFSYTFIQAKATT